MLLGTLRTSLLQDISAGTGVIRAYNRVVRAEWDFQCRLVICLIFKYKCIITNLDSKKFNHGINSQKIYQTL